MKITVSSLAETISSKEPGNLALRKAGLPDRKPDTDRSPNRTEFISVERTDGVLQYLHLCGYCFCLDIVKQVQTKYI